MADRIAQWVLDNPPGRAEVDGENAVIVLVDTLPPTFAVATVEDIVGEIDRDTTTLLASAGTPWAVTVSTTPTLSGVGAAGYWVCLEPAGAVDDSDRLPLVFIQLAAVTSDPVVVTSDPVLTVSAEVEAIDITADPTGHTVAIGETVQAQLDELDASGGGDVTGPASAVDSEVALFSGTTGKVVKRATGTGLAKITSGVLGTAAAGTDYYNPGGTDVAVADGGTGASTASAARTNLGLVIGTDVLAPNGNGSALTNLNGANLTNNTVTIAKIDASGTPSGSTYLDGSGAWSTPTGGGSSWLADEAAIVADVADLTDATISGWRLTDTPTVATTVDLPDPGTTGHEIMVVQQGWPWSDANWADNWAHLTDPVSWIGRPSDAIPDTTTVVVRLSPQEVSGSPIWAGTFEYPAALSDAAPADLGTAASGTSVKASRSDHVHDMPTAADVGAAATSHTHDTDDIVSGVLPVARGGTGSSTASVVHVVKTADQAVNNSTTRVPDLHLTFSAAASTTYLLDLVLFVTGPAAGDFRYAIDAPTGSTVIHAAHAIRTTDTVMASPGLITADDTPLTVGADTAGNMVHIHAYVAVAGTAGDIALNWAQAVATAGDTIVKLGSHMTVTRT